MNTVLYVLSGLTALAATIVAMILIVPEKKGAKLKGFGAFLHNILNFKSFLVEKIFHFLYVLCMCACIFGGFFMLFNFEEVYHYGGYYYDGYWTTEWNGYWGFLIMIGGPIAVRIAYEFIMMFILAVKNILEINRKLKGDVTVEAPATPVAPVAPAAPAQPTSFCPNCGTPTNPDGSCPNCSRYYR